MRKKTLFWGTIILGWLIPWGVIVGAAVLITPKDALFILESVFTDFGSYFLFAWNDVPFIVLAFLVLSAYDKPLMQDNYKFFEHRSGVSGAVLCTIGVSLFFNISIWADVYKQLEGSSTSVIAYMFLPFYAFVAMLLGYAFGRLICRICRKATAVKL